MVVGRIPLKCGGLSRHDDDDDVCFVRFCGCADISRGFARRGGRAAQTHYTVDRRIPRTSTEIPKIHIRNFETSL